MVYQSDVYIRVSDYSAVALGYFQIYHLCCVGVFVFYVLKIIVAGA